MLYFDRLATTLTGSGTGTLTPSATAPDGSKTPQSRYPDNVAFEYSVDFATQWEDGIGYFTSSGTVFNRAQVAASSNSDALVDFAVGTKTIVVTPLSKSLRRLSIGRGIAYKRGRGGPLGPAIQGGVDHIINPGLAEEVILDTPGWHCVARPAGAKSFKGTITGGGAGGGGGEGAAAASARVGGGGGGSSGTSRFGYRAEKLPFVWVYIGDGGLGGNGGSSGIGATGSSGERSWVGTHMEVVPGTTPQTVLAVSGAVAAAGGVSHTTAAGPGGAAGTVSADTDAPLSQSQDCLGYDYVAGRAGGNGSDGVVVGVAVTLGTGCVTLGGTGGGGVTTGNAGLAGGEITGVAACDFATVAGGAGGAAGTVGTCGFEAGLYTTGGTGGGGSTGGTGAAGGNGVRGSGGGGGGGGTTVGGAGGKGGCGWGTLIWE